MLEGRIPKNRERKKYMHESRHRHALNRARGKGGHFDSKDGDTPKRGKVRQHQQEVNNIQMSDKENSSGQDWHLKEVQMAIPYQQKINLLRRGKLL